MSEKFSSGTKSSKKTQTNKIKLILLDTILILHTSTLVYWYISWYKSNAGVPHWQYLCSFWESDLPTVCWNTHGLKSFADLFLYSYEAGFVQNLLHEKKKSLAVTINLTFWYTDDALSINNNNFHSYESSMSASYLDISLNRDINGKLNTQLYDKRDDFNFSIVKFPYFCNKIPWSHEYRQFLR